MSINVHLIKRRSNARKVDATTRKFLYRAFLETGLAIETRVKQTAPYKTGNLRSSYHVWGSESKLEVFVGSDPIADYAVQVEYGTSRQRAQPHLRPAVKAEHARHKSRVNDAMKRAAGAL